MPTDKENFMLAQGNVLYEFPELMENFPETAPLFRFFYQHLEPGQSDAFRAAAAVDIENRDENTHEILENVFRLFAEFRELIRALKESDPQKHAAFMDHLSRPSNEADIKAAEEIFASIRQEGAPTSS